MICDECGSTHVQKQGKRVTRYGKLQRYQCQDCGHWMKQTTAMVISKFINKFKPAEYVVEVVV